MVNHDDRASREVLAVSPRQPLQRQRILPPVLLVGVGVIAAIKAVNHHKVVLVFLLDPAELAIPLHVPFTNDIHALLNPDEVELTTCHPLTLVAIQPQALTP